MNKITWRYHWGIKLLAFLLLIGSTAIVLASAVMTMYFIELDIYTNSEIKMISEEIEYMLSEVREKMLNTYLDYSQEAVNQ